MLDAVTTTHDYFLDPPGPPIFSGPCTTGSVHLGLGTALETPSYVDVAPGPWRSRLGDLNSDGLLDLVIGSFESGQLVALLGHGDGTFQPGTPSVTSPWLSNILIDDIDADEALDAIVLAEDSLIVLRGTGNGTLARHGSFHFQSLNEPAAIGDVDGDGHPDLALSTFGQDGTVHILLGDGTGDFHARSQVDAGWVQDLALADLDADGILDLVVAAGDWPVSCATVFLGTGGGDFDAGLGYADGEAVKRLAIGDVSGDGRRDMVLADACAVSVLRNRLGPTPIEVSDLEAVWMESSVRLSWRLSQDAVGAHRGVLVERAAAVEGPYRAVGTSPLAPALRMFYEDASPEPDRSTWYRIHLVGGALDGWSTPIPVPAHGGSIRPTLLVPFEAVQRAVRIRYSIPTVGSVRLAVFDVSGRMLWSRMADRHEAGSFVVAWAPDLPSGGRAASGIYIVRLETPAASLTRKFVLLRP
jgi:hypothetical protein